MIRLSEVLKEVKSTNDAYLKALETLAEYLKVSTKQVDILPPIMTGVAFYRLTGPLFKADLCYKNGESYLAIEALGKTYSIRNQQLVEYLFQQVVNKI